MDELFDKTRKCIEARLLLEPIDIPQQLKHITLPLKLLDLRCYNWRAEKIRKIYFMRIKVAVPSLDIFGMAIYPTSSLDIPSFVLDFSCTRKKVFAYVNFIPLFSDESYREKYIEGMKSVHSSCLAFPPQVVRDWMKPYVTDYTIYTFPPTALLSELKKCALSYLTLYLDIFARAEVITDAGYAARVEKAQQSYSNQLVTHDNSQKMLGKIIGRERARRIFHEVVI